MKRQGNSRNSMIAEGTRRDRPFQIIRLIHCANNTKPDANDKMWKRQAFMNKLKSK